MTELENDERMERLKPKKSIDEKSVGSMSGHKYSIKDFKIIRSLGKGSYGEVFVAKSKVDKRQYAVKMISKNELEKVGGC
jgi:serine/threonine protein kinase